MSFGLGYNDFGDWLLSASTWIPEPSGAGSTYYVSTTGSDGNVGSEVSPWLTPGKAATTATTAGDVVVFEDGTYTATSSPMATIPGGSSGAPITWVARNKGSTIFDGAYYNDFGLLIEGIDYFDVKGVELRNFAYSGIWSNTGGTTGTTQCGNITIKYCNIHHNGRKPRSAADQLGYVGIYGNGNSENWTIRYCAFYHNGRPAFSDWDDETSGNNHTYRHDHHIYLEGVGHVVEDNYFFEATSGYPVRVSGYWQSALSSGEYSLTVRNNKFYTSGNNSPYGDVHGFIGVYNNQTNHSTYGNLKEPVLNIEGNTAAASQAGTGTDTFVGFFNDPLSYGSTTTEHRIVDNTVDAAATYNEGESWLASHTGITASGNTTSSTVSAGTLAGWITAASTLVGSTVRATGAYLWTPFALAETKQAAWFDASVSSSVTEVSSKVSQWDSLFYTSVNFAQGTAANRPDYVSSEIKPLDSTDFMDCSGLNNLTNADFLLFMVGNDNKGSVGGWIRATAYGGGNGFKLNHFGSSWFVYFDEGGGGENASFSSASYTANADTMFGFKHDAGTDFEVFQDGTSQTNFTPATAWTSTDFFLFPSGGGVGMEGCREILAISADVTTATRQLAEGYLAWENGIQGSLPGGHPWASERPYISE